MNLLDHYNRFISQSPEMLTLSSLAILLGAAALANFVIKRILLRFLNRIMAMTRFGRDDELRHHAITSRLANIVPTIMIMNGIKAVPHIPETAITVIQNVGTAFIILTIALALNSLLNIITTLHARNPKHAHKPIKGYTQIIKIGVYFIATILSVAALIDKSPVILLSGLGAMAAVLMLVFQDTLLSFVASIQISSSDMVRVGDWIEMPQLNADGDVIDIALHTVKVQNWDKTITTLPTRRLITDPFKNWRGMRETGGRRIKRALYIDQNSIHFLTDEEFDHLKEFKLLQDYLNTKHREIVDWNETLDEPNRRPVNQRRLTNIGTFRAYVQNYLTTHKGIHQDLTLLVRQLHPTENGLPVEIYCFTNDTAWAVYEGIQSDIFDHLYAIMPEFGLYPFQNPGGRDFQKLAPR